MARRRIDRCGIFALAKAFGAREMRRVQNGRLAARNPRLNALDSRAPFDTARKPLAGLAERPLSCMRSYGSPFRRFRPLIHLGLGVSALVVWTAAGAFEPAAAQGVVKGKNGDWETRCETPPGAQHEQCALIQSVAAEDRPNITLVVIVLRTADGKSRLLRVIAPLGVLLPSGLGLKIDQTDVGRAAFVRCLPNGCVAEVVMDDKLIDEMKTGKSATFVIFQTPEEGIGIPLALAGFKEGFDQLP
jgi:invasion protein IalB